MMSTIGYPVLLTVLAIGVFVYRGIQFAREYKMPIKAVPARVFFKRTDLTGLSTAYFVTFELDGGGRLDLRVPKNQFDRLTEETRGTLQYKGRLFLGFRRRLDSVALSGQQGP